MEKDNYNANLADMNKVFDNKTLRYRINGFADACGIKSINMIGSNSVLFNKKKGIQKDELPYYIVANDVDNIIFGKGTTISGYYGDLNFMFTNFYGKKNLNRKILELPFYITLYKTIDEETYHLYIEGVDGIQVKFTINKSREYKDKTISSKITFCANVMDFSKILKLVKSFVYNPKLVFSTYNEIIANKKIVFTNANLSKGIMQDTNLDKPVGKVKKRIRKIFD